MLELERYRAQNQMHGGWLVLLHRARSGGSWLHYAEQVAQRRAGSIRSRHLRADKIYIFSSRNDDTVEHGVVEAAARILPQAGVPEANISFVTNDKAAHAFLTEPKGPPAARRGPPYLNDCDYDQAKADSAAALSDRCSRPAAAVEANYLHFEQAPLLVRPARCRFRR